MLSQNSVTIAGKVCVTAAVVKMLLLLLECNRNVSGNHEEEHVEFLLIHSLATRSQKALELHVLLGSNVKGESANQVIRPIHVHVVAGEHDRKGNLSQQGAGVFIIIIV